MQLGFYFDQTRCTGCQTCAVACKDWNNIGAGPVKWRIVMSNESGVFPNLSLKYLSFSCLHCAEPPCVEVCPAGAITKSPENGIVSVEREKCVPSCKLCLDACPYGVPQFDDGAGAGMQMCDFCPDRLSLGQKPACVDACPMRALDSGPTEELKGRYGPSRAPEGFDFNNGPRPSIIIKS